MEGRSNRIPRATWWLALGLTAVMLSPLAAAAPAPRAPQVAVTALAGGGTINAFVTWNGQNISSAGSLGSAFTLAYSSSIDVRFHWSVPASGLPSPVDTARLEMFFFGFGVSTRDVTQASAPTNTSGTIDMAWDYPATLQYLLTGTYLVTASLLASGGSSLWSENFYVHLSAPYTIGAAFPIIFLVLGAYELYVVAVSGAHDAKKAKPAPPKTSDKTPPKTDGKAPDAETPENGGKP